MKFNLKEFRAIRDALKFRCSAEPAHAEKGKKVRMFLDDEILDSEIEFNIVLNRLEKMTKIYLENFLKHRKKDFAKVCKDYFGKIVSESSNISRFKQFKSREMQKTNIVILYKKLWRLRQIENVIIIKSDMPKKQIGSAAISKVISLMAKKMSKAIVLTNRNITNEARMVFKENKSRLYYTRARWL